MAHELAIPIRHHTFGDAMETHNLLEIEIGHLGGIIGCLARKKVRHLGESVNHDDD